MNLENAPLQYWLTIKNPNCDCSHMQRGFRNTPEYIKYSTNPSIVWFHCDNIRCKYEYQINKTLFFMSDNSILSYLKCPYCLKLNVKVTWIFFENPLLEQYENSTYFIYHTNTYNRTCTGSPDVYRQPPPNILSGAILHTHKQYTISLG